MINVKLTISSFPFFSYFVTNLLQQAKKNAKLA